MEGFWQAFAPEPVPGPPYEDRISVELAPRQFLTLPIRPLPAANTAVASFIANQASFAVLDVLTARMVAIAAEAKPEVVVGLPTLGLAFAPGVARGLGHDNFVALGYSRKFWYQDELSVPIRSITTPGEGKRLYIDPLIMPRLAGRRVVVVDDVASTGASLERGGGVARQAWRGDRRLCRRHAPGHERDGVAGAKRLPDAALRAAAGWVVADLGQDAIELTQDRHARTAPPRLDPRAYPLRRRDGAGAPGRVGPRNECAGDDGGARKQFAPHLILL